MRFCLSNRAHRQLANLLLQLPRRLPGPVAQGLCSPGGGLILVARSTGIRNLILICHGGGNEPKRMSVHLNVVNSGLDGRHVTGDAIASRAAHRVMRVLLNPAGVGSVRRAWAVAFQAHHVRGLE